MSRSLYGLALVAVAALCIFAGCGGGGSKSLPAMQQGTLGAKVGVTFTFTIGGSSTQSGSQRTPKYLPTTTQSIVIEYVGDNPAATPAPGSAPPSNATVATTVNITTSATNPPPAGSCFNNSGSFICTITAQLPVGILDFYVLAFDGQNGTGNQVAGNVTIVQVSQNGALTAPGTTTPVAIVLGASASSVAFNIVNITPNGVPNASVTPPSYPATAAPYVYSPATTLVLGGVPANTAINTIVVTDTDTSGNTCLVYVKAGATSATPCPLASAASSVSLTNSSDSFSVLYNGTFIPGGKITITATGASPLPVPVGPGIVTLASATVPSLSGPTGSIVYDPMSKKVYVGMGDDGTPLYAIPYSSATGYGAPTAITVTSVNGAPASALSGTTRDVNGGVNEMVLGPDNNIWIAEHSNRRNVQYVAVAAINSPVINPLDGTTIQPGAGVFVEYALNSNSSCCSPDGSVLKAIASMGGYVWVMHKDGGLWRFNPANGLVNPNLATGYLPGQTATMVNNLTDSTGANPIVIPGSSSGGANYSALIPISGKLYWINNITSMFEIVSVDTSATPSAGLCTPAGPPPCIGTYQNGTAGVRSYSSGNTDGTSYYTIDDNTSKIDKITPPSTLVTSAVAMSSFRGGITIMPDGWIWTLTNNGVAAMPGMTATGAVSATSATCPGAPTRSVERGAFPLVQGPDGSLLYSPNYSDNSSTTVPVLCAVVY